ncbi:MAG TPA: hypothetical protein VFC53_05070 [Dehalococcoidia bacterium]|jgi:hypothetical protein|nr:hypothetical protein [Dehalococcoidia bacterium]
MPTFVAIVNWDGDAADLRKRVARAAEARAAKLGPLGLHSLMLLPDDPGCAAVMVARAADEAGVRAIASEVVPDAVVSVETMRFDEGPSTPIWSAPGIPSPPGRASDYRRKLLRDITRVA